ncbi:hypothetical protein ACYVL9_001084 [Vibrio fluvialis]|uniref:hypothetical protein n=1 Tax=Vibrio fluvialis TaxID=676 RepID=UPI001559117F|nr:hypothetical protein [Vibrio fluvialis]EKO3408305.1 hypothetical protein [Vibrio fluvialis]EKO3495420.1 hypothetical protein [Vibrio fluvialis]EKO3534982.1 hypothetical protein [Vibrio fluvialis]ELP2651824.1 hypothetical protein [Vibrio fluvialis]ELV8683690.1 hypothetical protein [Vibrio fluvialis]
MKSMNIKALFLAAALAVSSIGVSFAATSTQSKQNLPSMQSVSNSSFAMCEERDTCRDKN